MNKKTVNVLLLLAIVILAGTPVSFARPQYLINLSTVYGTGSCATCHVNATNDGPRTPYGILFENQPNHTVNASAALRAIGAPSAANLTLTPTVTLTPAATSKLTAIPTATPEATPIVTTVMTTVTATEAPKTPGFGIVSSLLGLFALALLVKRNNR